MVKNTTSLHLDDGNNTGTSFYYPSTTKRPRWTSRNTPSTTQIFVQPDSEGDGGISPAVIVVPVIITLAIVLVIIVGVIVWRRRARNQPNKSDATLTGNDVVNTLLPSVSAVTKAPKSSKSSNASDGAGSVNPISKLLSRFHGHEGKATKHVNGAEKLPTIVIEGDANGSTNGSERGSNDVQQTIPESQTHALDDPSTEDYQGFYLNCAPTAVHVGDSYIEFVSPNHEEEPADYDYAYTYLCDSENGMGVYMGGDGSIYEDVDGLLREASAGRDRVSIVDIQDYLLPNNEPVRCQSQPDLQRRPIPLPKPQMSRTPDVTRKSLKTAKEPMKVPDCFIKTSSSNELADNAKHVEDSNDSDKDTHSIGVDIANGVHGSNDSNKDKPSIMMRPKLRTNNLFLNSVKLSDVKSRLRLIATPADKDIHKSFVIKSDNTSTKEYELLPAKKPIGLTGNQGDNQSGSKPSPQPAVRSIARMFEDKVKPS